MFYNSVLFKQLVIIHFLMLIASFQKYSLLRQGTEEQRSKVPGSMINILYISMSSTLYSETVTRIHSSLRAFLTIHLTKTECPSECDENEV